MRRIPLMVITLLLVAIGCVSPASGTNYPPVGFGTIPGWPTSDTAVSLRAWTTFGDTGQQFDHSTYTKTGTAFTVNIYMQDLHGSGLVFLTVMVEDGGAANVGLLAPGHYTVNANVFLIPWSLPRIPQQLGSVSGAFDVVTPGTTSPRAVSNFTAVEGDSSATLSWQNPTDAGFTSTMIRYDMNSYPNSMTDGQLLCDRAGAPGSSDSYTHINNYDGHRYYYSAFSYPPNPMACVQTTAMLVHDTTIPIAKGMQNSNARRLRGYVVSAAFGDSFYIQDPLKPWGIKVIGAAPTPGQTVDIVGTPSSYHNERAIDCRNYEITVVNPSPSELPVASLGNLALGGATLNTYSPGVFDAHGPNNLGLLVCTWGKVTQRDRSLQFFYIDDGSGLRDGTQTETSVGVWEASVGVRIKANPTAYAKGSYVSVTGISSCFSNSGVLKRQVLPRPGGIQLLRP